jgi:hypothetical protein
MSYSFLCWLVSISIYGVVSDSQGEGTMWGWVFRVCATWVIILVQYIL